MLQASRLFAIFALMPLISLSAWAKPEPVHTIKTDVPLSTQFSQGANQEREAIRSWGCTMALTAVGVGVGTGLLMTFGLPLVDPHLAPGWIRANLHKTLFTMGETTFLGLYVAGGGLLVNRLTATKDKKANELDRAARLLEAVEQGQSNLPELLEYFRNVLNRLNEDRAQASLPALQVSNDTLFSLLQNWETMLLSQPARALPEWPIQEMTQYLRSKVSNPTQSP